MSDVLLLPASEIPLDARRSGYDFMSRETRAMQDDDTSNPATLWVLDGEALWNAKAGTAQKSCADCHRDLSSMKGVAARYPAFDDKRGKAVDLESRINFCRIDHQQAPPLASESREMLALSAAIARQSRGEPIAPDESKMAATIDAGREIYYRRQGQLNLSCANCHNDNWDRKLAGSALTRGHPTGYPLYRLEWQNLGSLQRRLRNCMVGMRAESYAPGSPEFTALEAFLMYRARGMKLESPAVRP
ncbi:MAG TPA: sulfur oxidation c-type cytochrome SoxA [Xanthobacteraceae bacterium]|nr:sulfur oxidation c-type cytochrome SoxA [Xanthobacteraceae bacterium]